MLVAVTALALACGSSGEASTTSVAEVATTAEPTDTTTTTATDPTDDGVTRVLFAGDSLMEEIHATTDAALDDSVETRFLLSPRLIRDDTQELIWQAALDDFRPDVVVVLFSHWERLVVGAQTPGDIEDLDAYVGLVALPFAELIAENNAELVWLSAPALRNQTATSVYDVLNEAYRMVAAAAPGTRFVELGPVITDGSGAYVDSLPDATGALERVRNTDGIHFCPPGAVRVADAVLIPLAEVAGTTTVEGWQDDDWRTTTPFDRPDECPPL